MILFLAIALLAQSAQPQPPARYRFKVVKSFAHDPRAFTQGLEFRDGTFYEGTGLNGRSSLRRVNLNDGQVLQQTPLSSQYFGEGITVLKDRILQLTWQAGTGFIYDRKTFKQTGQFKYPGEGWGLTNDGKNIYMSDGTPQIRIWDATTLKELRRITVKSGNRPIDQINELEWIDGEIYANVWQTDFILRINPSTGTVTGIIDMTGLLDGNNGTADVLNGIAYDAPTKRLFVTGKLWPKIYQVELVRVQ
ncbi:MAG: glutaminyl-peptide cyclotransferase [Acidobacteria bacterium]|nr:glutaminyl-peptide cyclotransferase [Acidobacteriota bacterium]